MKLLERPADPAVGEAGAPGDPDGVRAGGHMRREPLDQLLDLGEAGARSAMITAS